MADKIQLAEVIARKLTVENELVVGSTSITAAVLAASLDELGALNGLTASVAELNTLDGITASTAELNITDGVTKTAAQINALVGGVAGGYRIARGVASVNADSFDVVTGLTTCVAVVVSMVGNPSATHLMSSGTVGNQSNAPAAGSIRILSWKPTAADNSAPTAATSPFGSVAWIAIGV